MNRLFKTIEAAGQGGVYRNIDTDNSCIDSFVVPEFEAPDCEIYPSSSENIGSLPDSYGSSEEIDPVAWVDAWNDVYRGGLAFDPTYPNLWRRLTENPNPGAPLPAPAATLALIAHRVFLLAEYASQCYCPGDGISFVRLRTGTPKFPDVETLPFFWLPTAEALEAPIISVREDNPDGPPLPDTCCNDGEIEGIKATIENGQLLLERRERPEKEYNFNKYDEHEAFQAVAGYPKWCCVEDACTPGKFVMRYLHFPTWPRQDTHDPLECGGGKEPLGFIPFVTDVTCTASGELAVYYGALVVHNGIISDIQWDIPDPRPGITSPPPEQAPDDPETLAVNTDYQGSTILVDGFASPVAPDANGDTCAQAQALLGKVPCPLECPDDVDICPPAGVSQEITSNDTTAQLAANLAIADAQAAMPVGCTSAIYICGIEELPNGTFDATVKFCC